MSHHPLHHCIYSLFIIQSLFESVNSFTTPFSFKRKLIPVIRDNNNNNCPRLTRHQRTSINLSVDPVDITTPPTNPIHWTRESNGPQIVHEKIIPQSNKNDVGASSFVTAGGFFGGGGVHHDAYPIGRTIRPVGNDQSYTAVIKPENMSPSPSSSVTTTPTTAAEDRQFKIFDVNGGSVPIVDESEEFDQRAVEFYTQDAVVFAKLPLAAIVYATFEFFFMNQKRVQDMYYGDDDWETEDEDEEERKQFAEFGGTFLLRIGAAFFITFMTVVLS